MEPVSLRATGSTRRRLLRNRGAEAGMIVADTAAEIAAAVIELTHDNGLWSRLSAGGVALVERTLGPDACEAAIRRIVEAPAAGELAA